MDRVDDTKLYAVLKSSGTYHIARDYQNYDSEMVTYKSLCGQYRRRAHQSEKPIRIKKVSDIPSTHRNCKKCVNKFEKDYKDVTVVIEVPKSVVKRIVEAGEQGREMDSHEVSEIARVIKSRVPETRLE